MEERADEPAEFRFLNARRGPKRLRGQIAARDGGMTLTVHLPGDRPYVIAGIDRGGYFEGDHHGQIDDVPVHAKWTRLGEMWIGTWREANEDFLFTASSGPDAASATLTSSLGATHADEAAEINALRAALRQLEIGDLDEPVSWGSPAVDILDCVLSLHTRYETVVLPRVMRFREAHPEVTTVKQLRTLIRRYKTPLAFSVKELRYNDEGRATTLAGVVDFVLRVEQERPELTEDEKLRGWADSVAPSDYKIVGVRGFALAGFQYLRMLFGADTAKPDVWICRFVTDAIGRTVKPVEALRILETACEQEKLSVRAADQAIWYGSTEAEEE